MGVFNLIVTSGDENKFLLTKHHTLKCLNCFPNYQCPPAGSLEALVPGTTGRCLEVATLLAPAAPATLGMVETVGSEAIKVGNLVYSVTHTHIKPRVELALMRIIPQLCSCITVGQTSVVERRWGTLQLLTIDLVQTLSLQHLCT